MTNIRHHRFMMTKSLFYHQLNEQLQTFIKHIRVQLTDGKEEDNKLRTLFTSSAKKTVVPSQMTPSLVS